MLKSLQSRDRCSARQLRTNCSAQASVREHLAERVAVVDAHEDLADRDAGSRAPGPRTGWARRIDRDRAVGAVDEPAAPPPVHADAHDRPARSPPPSRRRARTRRGSAQPMRTFTTSPSIRDVRRAAPGGAATVSSQRHGTLVADRDTHRGYLHSGSRRTPAPHRAGRARRAAASSSSSRVHHAARSVLSSVSWRSSPPMISVR